MRSISHGTAAEDELRDRRVVEQPGVGRVVVGHEDDRALGVRRGRARRPPCVRRLAAAAACAAGARPGGRSSSGGRAGRRRRERRPAAPCPRSAAIPASDARRRGEAERPPVGAVHLLELDLAVGAPSSRSRPAATRRPALARRGGRAVDRAQRLDQVAQPGLVEVRASARGWRAALGMSGQSIRTAERSTSTRDRTALPKMASCPHVAHSRCSTSGGSGSGSTTPGSSSSSWSSSGCRASTGSCSNAPRRRDRPVRAGRRQRARLLRLDPAARARPRLRRHAARDRHLGHHAVDVRRRRAHDQRLGLARAPSSRSRSRARS